ncbi:MAG: hypothetical protein A2201_09650 [Alicyclobacillus sp. RIFOXYA1_FULL_53_8]|nr:MAG: hypothetical protein A2201_09650 [Alicyclobacillus sp. RIFOXYA1_FULL_53_8]
MFVTVGLNIRREWFIITDKITKSSRKRGQRRNNIGVPQRLLDHLTPTVLEKLWITTGNYFHNPVHWPEGKDYSMFVEHFTVSPF